MSLLSQLLEQIGYGHGSSEAPATEGADRASLLDSLLNMVGGEGGLGRFVQNFQERGLSDVVNSWVSTGENLPITSEQLEQGLGKDQVQQLAERSGVALQSVLPMLSQLLPNVIDKLTPQGSVPTGGLLEQALNLFRSDEEETLPKPVREGGDYGTV
jgi:uncharacterized protein YidB (DUF937 family)